MPSHLSRRDLAAAESRYAMRITGDNEGKAQLDNFIDPESAYPVIATTSQLMSTGVDAQTCHLIVLDKSPVPKTRPCRLMIRDRRRGQRGWRRRRREGRPDLFTNRAVRRFAESDGAPG